MKRSILIHGWDGNPENAWFPWLKKELEEKEFEVLVPEMPHSDKPEINSWVSKLNEIIGKIEGDVYLIGHSIGCQTILRYLERVKEGRIKGSILVAPWITLDEKTLEEEGPEVESIARPWMKTPIDFKKARKHCENFGILYSTNDHYVNMGDLIMLKEKLDATMSNCGEMGHFDDANGIKKVPMILNLLDEIEDEE